MVIYRYIYLQIIVRSINFPRNLHGDLFPDSGLNHTHTRSWGNCVLSCIFLRSHVLLCDFILSVFPTMHVVCVFRPQVCLMNFI